MLVYLQSLQAPKLRVLEMGAGAFYDRTLDAHLVSIIAGNHVTELRTNRSIHPCVLAPTFSSSLEILTICLPEESPDIGAVCLLQLPTLLKLRILDLNGLWGEATSFLSPFVCLERYLSFPTLSRVHEPGDAVRISTLIMDSCSKIWRYTVVRFLGLHALTHSNSWHMIILAIRSLRRKILKFGNYRSSYVAKARPEFQSHKWQLGSPMVALLFPCWCQLPALDIRFDKVDIRHDHLELQISLS